VDKDKGKAGKARGDSEEYGGLTCHHGETVAGAVAGLGGVLLPLNDVRNDEIDGKH